MSWLSNLFATRRELKRLAADNKYLRGRVISLETENREYRQREFLIFDRFLVAKVGTYPITDEAQARAQTVPQIDAQKQYEEDKRNFLQVKKNELIQDAQEAGVPIAEAEKRYNQNEPYYIEEFESQTPFY